MSKESKNLMSANDLADILRIIDEEPELPGDMSDDLWNRLRGYDRDGLTEALRILVRTTKDCISERILEQVGDKDSTAELFVVRFYDGFDNQWMDVSAEVSKIEADRIWNDFAYPPVVKVLSRLN